MMRRKTFNFFALMMVIFLFIGTLPTYAVNPYGSITLTFISDDKVDLSGIEIDVYSSALSSQSGNLKVYDDTYAFTVTTNANGVATFEKPSENCAITVTLNTLPQNTGINKKSVFCSAGVRGYTFTVSNIAEVSISNDKEKIIPSVTDKNGNSLHVDYTVVAPSISNIDTLDLNGSLNYVVDVNGSTYNCVMSPNTLGDTETEKIVELYKYGVLTWPQTVTYLCETFVDMVGQTTLTASSDSEVLNLRGFLQDYFNTLNSNDILYDTLNNALSINRSRTEPTPYDYQNEYNDRIIVYYPSSLENGDDIANIILEEMENVYSYFVDELGMTEPNIPTSIDDVALSNNKFAVVIKTGIGLGDVAGNVISSPYFIEIDPTTINSVEQYKTVLAHEFQHCIQLTCLMDCSADIAWTESCANMAAAIYAKEVLDDYPIHAYEWYDGINGYLASPYYGLLWAECNPSIRVYSMLYPLFLYEEYGGWATIKSIYSKSKLLRANSNVDLYTVLDQGLSQRNVNYSFENTFCAFVETLYDPAEYYSEWSTSSWDDLSAYEITDFNDQYNDEGDFYDCSSRFYRIHGQSNETVYLGFDVTTTDIEKMSYWIIESDSIAPSLSSVTSSSFADMNVSHKSITYEFDSSNQALVFVPINHAASWSNFSIEIFAP